LKNPLIYKAIYPQTNTVTSPSIRYADGARPLWVLETKLEKVYRSRPQSPLSVRHLEIPQSSLLLSHLLKIPLQVPDPGRWNRP
jgi:hypothetical protein